MVESKGTGKAHLVYSEFLQSSAVELKLVHQYDVMAASLW